MSFETPNRNVRGIDGAGKAQHIRRGNNINK